MSRDTPHAMPTPEAEPAPSPSPPAPIFRISIRTRITLYFIAGFVPQWIVEGTSVLANGGTHDFTFLHWSLLIARSLWAGLVPVISYIDNSSK